RMVRSTSTFAVLSRSCWTAWILPGSSETMVTSAPASRTARTGRVSSDSSTPAVARTATRQPFSSGRLALLVGGGRSTKHASRPACPCRSPSQRVGGNQVAEVGPAVAGLRLLEHVGVHRPERGRRLVAEADGERPHDPAPEVGPRVRREHGVAVAVGDLLQPAAPDVPLD